MHQILYMILKILPFFVSTMASPPHLVAFRPSVLALWQSLRRRNSWDPPGPHSRKLLLEPFSIHHPWNPLAGLNTEMFSSAENTSVLGVGWLELVGFFPMDKQLKGSWSESWWIMVDPDGDLLNGKARLFGGSGDARFLQNQLKLSGRRKWWKDIQEPRNLVIFLYIPIYIYIYSVCLASFWGYSNAECSNYIEPTRKSCMTCCFLHPHFSWPAILSWRFREQALSTAALRQLWWRSWSAKRRSRALNSAISLQPRRGVRLFWFHRVWKIMLQKKGSGKDRKNNMEKNEQSLYESVKRFLWGLNRRVREIWSFCIFLQLTSKKKQYLTVLNF